jgi:hypothetical protein
MNKICKYISLDLLRKRDGASLMEFAVVTGLMAVLAATAAPKFSDISESGKFRKSKSEIEKIAKQALNFYQEKAVTEGRGRFPGQTKYNQKVGGHTSLSDLHDDLIGSYNTSTNENGETISTFVPPSFIQFDGSDGTHWVSVFGDKNEDGSSSTGTTLNDNYPNVTTVWQKLFGDEVLYSPYQDGHYVYQVFPGSGVGSQAEAPTLYIADLENPSQIHIMIIP